jgi:iron complex transport system substrate-binding protein
MVAAALAVLLLACGGPRAGGERPGLRVVSLVPSVTEVIFALGAESLLVGNTTECDYPEAAKRVPKVGDFVVPDMERVLALSPGLVCLALPVHAAIAQRLGEAGIATYVSNPTDIDGVFAEIESLGGRLGRRRQADSLVASLRARLDSIPHRPYTPSVFVEISASPLMTAGRGTFVNELLSRAGGVNCFDDSDIPWLVVEPEAVVARNPAVILILHPEARAADVARRVGWDAISAVQSGRVYDGLDEDLLLRPGPRIVDGIRLLDDVLHAPAE